MAGFLRGLASIDREARLRQHWICDHGALSERHSTPSQLLDGVKNVPIQGLFMALQSLLKGRGIMPGSFSIG